MVFDTFWIRLLPVLYVIFHNARGTYADSSEAADVLQAIEVGFANMLAAKDESSGCVPMDDGVCLLEEDLSNYEAIKSLHRLLDDDKSGEIDMNESVDFLKEELTITDGYNSRQKNLHHNSDSYISVQDLWYMWTRSTVHNWTVEETVQWLSDTVGLPQYQESFEAHGINGSFLPSLVTMFGWNKCDEQHHRLTMNKANYLGNVLGIKGLSHRTKITVKAMDAVLFGPPKGSRIKDMLIVGLVTVILLGVGFMVFRNRNMRAYNSILIKQIEDLQQEEIKYRQHLLKVKEKASEESSSDGHQVTVPSEVPDSGVGGDVGSVSDVSSTDDDATTAAGASHDNYYDDESIMGSGTPPMGVCDGEFDRASLAHWLQVTYHKEKLVLDAKRKQAQTQIVKASEICNKLRAQGKNPLNLFSMMHGKIDNVEKTISLARSGMQEVQRDEKERQERWGEIERLLDCNIRRMAELNNVMGSYTSLQAAAGVPGDNASIEGGSIKGGSVRSTGSSLRGAPYSSLAHHSATVATELSRIDDAESVSLPRCSSFGSSNTARLLSSVSHQHLSDQFANDAAHYGNSRYPPQKQPRRNRSSSSVKNVASLNGVLSSGVGAPLIEDTSVESTVSNGTTDNLDSGKSTGFSMGGSPLVLPSDSPLYSKQAPHSSVGGPASDAVTTPAQNMTGSASDSMLSASSPAPSSSSPTLSVTSPSSIATSSAPSHHRTLSQLSSNDGDNLPPGSKLHSKKTKKSFLQRLTGSRKSINKSGKT